MNETVVAPTSVTGPEAEVVAKALRSLRREAEKRIDRLSPRASDATLTRAENELSTVTDLCARFEAIARDLAAEENA